MLVLTRKPQQSIRIGDSITVNVIRIKGNTIQLGIDAPQDIAIVRSELLEKKPSEEPAGDRQADDSEAAEKDADTDRLPPLRVVRMDHRTSQLVTAV